MVKDPEIDALGAPRHPVTTSPPLRPFRKAAVSPPLDCSTWTQGSFCSAFPLQVVVSLLFPHTNAISDESAPCIRQQNPSLSNESMTPEKKQRLSHRMGSQGQRENDLP